MDIFNKNKSGGHVTVNMSRPENKDDPFYRYTRPQAICVKEGGGNGKRTIIPNIAAIAGAMRIPVKYVSNFLGMELSCRSRMLDRGCELTGFFSVEQVEAPLDQMVALFVLCPRDGDCGLRYEKEGRGKRANLRVTCGACGYTGHLSAAARRHKMHKTIVMAFNPSDGWRTPEGANDELKEDGKPPRGQKGRKSSRKKDRKKGKSDSSEEENGGDGRDKWTTTASTFTPDDTANAAATPADDDWSMDTSPEAVRARQEAEFGADAVSKAEAKRKAKEERRTRRKKAKTPEGKIGLALADATKEGGPTVKATVTAIKRVKITEDLSDEQWIAALTTALFAQEQIEAMDAVNPHLEVLTALFKDQSALMKLLLTHLVDLVEQRKIKEKDVPKLLQAFYEGDIIEEDEICEWFDTLTVDADSPSDGLCISVDWAPAAVKESVSVFVEWLRTADEEEEEDDE